MARLTEKNQYDSENASTWMATQDASAHSRRTEAPADDEHPDAHRDHLRAEDRRPPRVVRRRRRVTIAGIVFRNDVPRPGVMARTQPVDWAWYQAVQLPVSV